MSTQHPDNVRLPFFADSPVMNGEDEIKEAFYVFSHLKIKEQLWDYEGKEVDNFVVRKLLSKYEHFFKENRLGKDFFLTFRIPNPEIERNEAKLVTEILESVPRSFDIAKTFYGEDVSPVFELSQPMTASAASLLRLSEYYKQMVIGKKDKALLPNDIPISKWIGDFQPDNIRIFPLFEHKENMLKVDQIMEEYIQKAKVEDYQRVWLARSDPALNYGSLAATLLAKISLHKLKQLQERLGVTILPALGCGCAPFRGNFKPTKVSLCQSEYNFVHTFTAQSAFKYDYDERIVTQAVDKLNESSRGLDTEIEEEKALALIDKLTATYQQQIQEVVPIVNELAPFVPKRRMRKLHIGLFGYSRSLSGIKLPRAISFCASLYSLGLPPELIGLSALNEKEWEFVLSTYPGMEEELKEAFSLLNEENVKALFPVLWERIRPLKERVSYETNLKHHKVTSILLEDFRHKHNTLTENMERAGWLRGYLG